MGISPFDYQQMLARVSRKNQEQIPQDAVSREVSELHEPIIRWCQAQVPFVPFIHARTDRKSTIAEGAPDFAIFYQGHALLIECKTKTGKMSPEQLGWALAAERQHFRVLVVRSMSEFLEAVNQIIESKTP